MDVVVVESPAKAKTINKYLGPGYEVLASYGHVRDLPRKGLGVDRGNAYEPTYVVVPGKEKTLGELKKATRARRRTNHLDTVVFTTRLPIMIAPRRNSWPAFPAPSAGRWR